MSNYTRYIESLPPTPENLVLLVNDIVDAIQDGSLETALSCLSVLHGQLASLECTDIEQSTDSIVNEINTLLGRN